MKLLSIFASALLVCCTNAVGNATLSFRNVLYVGDWTIYSKGLKPKTIPYNDTTHLVYAFGNFTSDGTAYVTDEFAATEKVFDGGYHKPGHADGLVGEFWKAKQARRSLKTLVAFGGWGGRENWAPTMKDPQKRANFVASATKLMLDWGMDGIDIDWEYPDTVESSRDALSLLQELRVALNESSKTANGYHFLLSFASPADRKKYQYFDFMEMDKALDFWSIMTYDYAGSWDNTTGHASNLLPDSDTPQAVKFNAKTPVSDYINAGINASKINVGLPLYGHVFSKTNGLGESYEGHPEALTSGFVQLKDLPHTSNSKEYFDEKAMAAYSYDGNAREFISYENKKSASKKVNFVAVLELGGMMYWDASGDRVGNESIVKHVAKEFDLFGQLERSENNLVYPGSKYANIRTLNGSQIWYGRI
ncbi:Chitinase 4 [Gnomoniopsis smithogilvyi]|uniref:chitinase n=1 Tax=Gnomoniopsis smithogilvyi TaxID=1191159 RepID=A0A9W8YQL0_9PEZI|nr:Chitinase 4 [Gnomoniopsis smithogilvyi]